jgi:two-component system, sensor histidine kinase PdtaS
MKKLLLVIILGRASILLWAQSNLPYPTINTLLDKSESLIYDNKDSALYYAHQALNLATAHKDNVQIFNTYRTIGYVYEENSFMQEAHKAYQTALVLADSKLSDTEKYKIYNDWAIINKKMGHYAIAHDYHWLTIKIAEKISNWEVVESGYNGLGTMYSIMGDDEKAILFFQKSIDAAEQWHNKMGVVLTLENMVGVYLKSKNIVLAQFNIEKAAKIAKELDDSTRIAAVLDLYGDIEMAAGNKDSARSKYQQANTIFLKKGEKAALCKSYLSLGTYFLEQKGYDAAAKNFYTCQKLEAYLYPTCSAELYQKLGKLYAAKGEYNKAITAIKISLQKTDSLDLKDMARQNHLALAEILKHQQQFETAYQHIVLANQLGEALYADSKNKNVKALQFKIDIEKRDSQIAEQQREINQANTLRLILGTSLILVLGLLFFTWRQMKAKLNAMRHVELLMKELHHRVKNNLAIVSSLLRIQSNKIDDKTAKAAIALQARHITDPSVLAVLGESRSRLEAISMIHQQLYRSEDVQSVNFKLFLEGLVEKQLFTHGMSEKELDTQIILENEFINVDLALPLGLIINELLTNSFKYAYPSVSHPKLQIEISNQKLFYADNGSGLPSQFTAQTSKSFGIQLISSLAQQLRGKFSFGNDNGMFFKLNFA